MSLLFRVIYAAHANGTHHKLALDALAELTGPEAETWRRLFLKHAGIYLKGSKAPDVEFKDFKNHVLHVRDGYWGGALEQSKAWYRRLVDELRGEKWPEAVFSAGVLSHYVVDPIHPFHTGQSDAESNVHRAVEWSISKSYDVLRALPAGARRVERPAIADGENWLEQLVCAGAERAHAEYHTLLAHYDLNRGVVDPPAGLDAHLRRVVAGLIAYASSAYSAVLDHALAEAGVTPPEVTLTAETVVAALEVPKKWVLDKIAGRDERRQVEAMFDELQATGKVDKTLTEDDRTMRDLYAREVQSKAAERQASVRSGRIGAAAQSLAALSPAAPPPPGQKPRLSASDNVEAAPSIGPKTAERMANIGITTVFEFIAMDADTIASRLAVRHIDAGTVRLWQDQARLALALPGLSGTNAQLLTGAGYRTIHDLSRTSAPDVAAELTRFAATPAGERLLRGGAVPAERLIAGWIETAGRLSELAA